MPENQKTQYVVINEFGAPYGPFEGKEAAAQWARRKWPNQKQDESRSDGWDIAVLHSPDES